MTRQTPLTILGLLCGLGLVFIGGRFLLSPEIAEQGFGIHFAERGDYAFHYVKGIRDLFTGLLLTVLALTGQRKALGYTLLLGALIPITDGLIVLSRSEATWAAASVHLITAIVCILTGVLLLRRQKTVKPTGPQPGYVHVVESASAGAAISVLEMGVAPGTGTPAHAHQQFAETFTVLAGELSVTLNGQTRTLQPGDSVTVEPEQSHGFQNKTADVCHIKVSIEPGNAPFEQAMQIYAGLMRDGLSTRAGTPKRIGDLAVFLYLNNSRMVGPARIVQSFFDWLARRTIRNGRLTELKNRYVTPVKLRAGL